MRLEFREFSLGDELALKTEHHGWSAITSAEKELILDFFRGKNSEYWMPQLEAAEGRNFFFRRKNPADGIYTHIQLSGGFYRDFTLDKNIAFNETYFKPASPINFAAGRESMFTTKDVTESGEFTTTIQEYVPRGAYTMEQAVTKAANTSFIDAFIAEANTKRINHLLPINAPYIISLYEMPGIADPQGIPLHGIAMLTSSPDSRLGNQIQKFMFEHADLPDMQFQEEVKKFILPRYELLAAAIRFIHDKFRVYHRQLTAGNTSILLSGSDDLTAFISDWHTMKFLPENKNAESLARVLDVIMPVYSLNVILNLFSEKGIISHEKKAAFSLSTFFIFLKRYLKVEDRELINFSSIFSEMIKGEEFKENAENALDSLFQDFHVTE